MDQSKTRALKWYLEGMFLSKIERAIQEVEEIPEVMHRVVVIQTTEDFCKEMKENYVIIKEQFATKDIRIDFTIEEFNQIVDDVASQVLFLLCE